MQGKDRQAGLTGGMVQVQVELTEAIDLQNQTIDWTVTGGGGSVPGKDALGSHVTSSRRQFMSRFRSNFFSMAGTHNRKIVRQGNIKFFCQVFVQQQVILR